MFPQMTEDTKTWWSDTIKSLGFPIVMCCALMYGGYQIFVTFVTPVFIQQMQAIKDVTETNAKIVDKLATVTTDIKEVKQTQAEHKAILAELTTSQKEALTTLKEIEKNTKKP